ncbi:eukaryotic translation initiation factor 3 subunit J-B isoform X1 [Sinocyclocheilus anshuiensis]|uniref:eukaryotic translation initiation factor 3 subunit J-B isoform X1 n=1 Tax=Sinocyclocheilus anshuiensis TaxID=1608454 RepID=UPI0007B7A4F7|nr:PREDICTED: eukaryotic translation initiation factor 3 subunit J-B-like isoform X1 [Sinocyclocheilus anshuiensis]
MADSDDWDVENFEPSEPIRSGAGQLDRWEGEDEEEDVKDNWDDDEEEEKEEEKKVEQKKAELKPPEKKKLSDKIKEKEILQKNKQDELKNMMKETVSETLSTEEQHAEKLRLKKLQEEADMELAREVFGKKTCVDPAAANASTTVITTNNASGIEAMCPSSKDDFVAFENLLKDKITQFEKSVHYSSFLESLFRELCISLEVDDLKKINNSLSVLLSEKQRQEKEKKANKKKKKGVVPGGGLKATMKDDFADYDDGYGNDFDDFM